MAKSKGSITDVFLAVYRHYNANKANPKEPDMDLAAQWETHFSAWPVQYLSKAIEKWVGSTEVDDFTGKPKGTFFPAIADLKLIIENMIRKEKSGDKPEHCGKLIDQPGIGNKVCTKDFWEYCVIPGIKPGSEEVAVRKCPCFIEWQESKNVV